jgi:outer membrane lipase/esterase
MRSFLVALLTVITASKRFSMPLAVALAVYGGTAQAAPSFSQLLVFGDSLIDSGNAHFGSGLLGIPDPTPTELGYYQGRFSNGYNFADYLSLTYAATPATSFLEGGTNFGVGGATAAYSPTEVSPSFLTQLQVFAGTMQPIAGDALVLVAFGGNDVRAVIADLGPVDFTPTLAAMSFGLASLALAGAQHIVVTGVADMGALPVSQSFGSTATALATARSQALNAQIEALVSSLALSSGANISFFDLFALEQSLRTAPAAYSLPALNTTATCQSGGAEAVHSGCSGYLYFDVIHPTTQVHAAIAGAIEEELAAVAEPKSWALLIIGFAFVAIQSSRRLSAGSLAFAVCAVDPSSPSVAGTSSDA